MATLTFNGTSNFVEFSTLATALQNLPTGSHTLVWLVRRTVTGAVFDDPFAISNNARTQTEAALKFTRSGANDVLNYDTTRGAGDDGVAHTSTTIWLMAAVTCVGADTPDLTFHYRDHTANAAWTHVPAAGGVTSPGLGVSPGATGFYQHGRWQTSDFFQGQIGVCAAWAGKLSNAQLDELIVNDRTTDWWNCSFGRPVHLVEFNAAATSLVDLTGNSTLVTPTSAPALTGPDPDRWTFDGTGPTPIACGSVAVASSTSAAQTLTLNRSVPAGARLVVMSKLAGNGGIRTITVTGGPGGWALDDSHAATGAFPEAMIHSAPCASSVPSGTALTLTPSALIWGIYAEAYYIQGIDTSSPVMVTGGTANGATSSTTATSGAMSIPDAGVVMATVFGDGVASGAATFTSGIDAALFSTFHAGNNWDVADGYKLMAASGSNTVTATFGSAATVAHALSVVGYRLAGAALPATAAGQYGWGTYGVGDYGPNFGDITATPIVGSETFGFTEQASVIQVSFTSRADTFTASDSSAAAIAADLQRTESFSFAELVSLTAALAASDALTHSESPSSVSVQQLLAVSDSWGLTDLSSLQTQTDMAANDSASQSESPSSVAADLQRTDAGSFTDASTVNAAVATSDSGGFSDASALQQTNALSASEAHAQGEASAVDAAMSRTDSGAFTDASSVAADLQRTDSWVFTDSPASIQSVTLIQAADSWAVAEAVASLTSTDAKSASDTLTITDTVQGITANITGGELIGLLESSAVDATLVTGEAFSLAELAATQAVQLMAASDAQTHSEQNSSISAATATSDSGTFSESSLVGGTVFFSANDTQTQDEQSAIDAALLRVDSSAFNDTSSLAASLDVSASDSATQSEQPSALSATLTASDASAMDDLVSALAQTAQKIASEAFTFNEASSLGVIVAITRTDTFSLAVEAAGVVVLTEGAYIHHRTPLSGLVGELTFGGTVIAMVVNGQVVSAATAGDVLEPTESGAQV